MIDAIKNFIKEHKERKYQEKQEWYHEKIAQAWSSGRHETASVICEKAIELAKKYKDYKRVFDYRLTQATIFEHLENSRGGLYFDIKTDFYLKAAGIAKNKLKNKNRANNIYEKVIRDCIDKSEFNKAAQVAKLVDKKIATQIYEERVQDFEQKGDNKSAAELAEEFEDYNRAIDNYRKMKWMGRGYLQAVRVAEKLGDRKKVEELCKEGIKYYESMLVDYNDAWSEVAATLADKLGDKEKATYYRKKAIEHLEQTGQYIRAATRCENIGDKKRAIENWKKYIQVLAQEGKYYDAGETAETKLKNFEMAIYYYRKGEWYEKAIRVAEEKLKDDETAIQICEEGINYYEKKLLYKEADELAKKLDKLRARVSSRSNASNVTKKQTKNCALRMRAG